MANDKNKSQTAASTKAPKVQNPKAYDAGKLPPLRAGCEWDEVEIAGVDFAILVAKDMTGISTLTQGDEDLAARAFNRWLRIDVPAKLDGRNRIKSAKPADREKVLAAIQDEVFKIDLKAIRPRAARTPVTVTVDPNKKNYSAEEVQELLRQAKVNVVTA